MKRIRGDRLDGFASAGRSRAELLRVFRQVCDAVAFAHAAGVIHRDLKPQNVMIGAFGEVLVLDWGVAKLRSRAQEPVTTVTPHPTGGEDTSPGAVMGTPGYMAPEQLAGQSDTVDERADVYGLGGILCYLLTGEHPPAGLPLGDRWGALPPPLRAICERARAPLRDRYRSASDLAADVANYLDALPVTAHREGLLERGRRVAARHRTALLLVLAYLVMRVTLLAVGGR